MISRPVHPDRLSQTTRLVIALGLVLSCFMWLRSQVAGDQLNLLARGWLLIAENQWIPYGLPTSAGGKAPGGLTSLLTGLPLMVWSQHRTPTLVILALNLVAYLLLDRMLSREMGPVARLLFAIAYWLSPWRLYHASFLWNANYLLPLGALHFWTMYRQRQRPRFWESFLQILLTGLAAQIHASAVVLVLLALLLWWRGYFHLHWPGAAAAVLVVGVSLIPWAQAVLHDSSLLPRGTPHNGRIAQTLLSSARGLGYWLRYPAMIASSTILCLDFRGIPTTLAGDPIRQIVQVAVGLVTVPVVIWSNILLWSGARGWWHRPDQAADFRLWIRGATRWTFVGVLLACILTPTAVMSWQLLAVLHLAVMPLVLLGDDHCEAGGRRTVARAASIWAVISVVMILAVAVGSPMFRCGGATCGAMNADPPPLRADHEMLDALGINATCPYETDVPGGWWPDVLPEH